MFQNGKTDGKIYERMFITISDRGGMILKREVKEKSSLEAGKERKIRSY
ncbi:MAG: hypothetical protein LBR53_02410 [Deltaproteobacteria bacterium]|jgi:hypothetical protein|nr:hypothetical protein [Deltaproteobacteria bacterium]